MFFRRALCNCGTMLLYLLQDCSKQLPILVSNLVEEVAKFVAVLRGAIVVFCFVCLFFFRVKEGKQFLGHLVPKKEKRISIW